MIHKNRKYRRRQRELHIKHKENIIRCHQLTEDTWMPVRGKLSKGKVHCSCKMCRFDSYTHQDAKQAVSMLEALQEEDLTTTATHTVEKLQKIRRKTVRGKSGSSHTQSTAEKFDYTDVLLEQEYRKLSQQIHNLYIMKDDVSNPYAIQRQINKLLERQEALHNYIEIRRCSKKNAGNVS